MKRTPSHNHRKIVQSYPEIPMIEYGKLMRALRLVDKACDVWLMKRAKINKVKADYWDGIHAEEKKHRYLQQETAASVPPEPSR